MEMKKRPRFKKGCEDIIIIIIIIIDFRNLENEKERLIVSIMRISDFAYRKSYILKGTEKKYSSRVTFTNKQTPWSESASELYRLSDRRLSEKLVAAFEDRGCHVVSVTDPYCRILDFLERSRYFSLK
jgi:hypothetical protein